MTSRLLSSSSSKIVNIIFIKKRKRNVHSFKSCPSKFLDILGGGIWLLEQANCIFISIVSSIGTFVIRLPTSSDVTLPLYLFVWSKSMKSLLDLSKYFVGMKGDTILFNFLGNLYVGDFNCDIMVCVNNSHPLSKSPSCL